MNIFLTRGRCENSPWILTLLFPATLALKHGVSLVFIYVAGIHFHAVSHTSPAERYCEIYAGWIDCPILVSLLSLLNADDIENGIRRIRILMSFVLLIPILMAMVSVRTNLIKPFMIGVCIGRFTRPIAFFRFRYFPCYPDCNSGRTFPQSSWSLHRR